MCKKNVNYYLTDSNKQIKVNDEVNYHQTVTFTKYPDMVFETSVTHPLDEEDIEALVEAEILEAKEVKPLEDYTSFLKWLANIEHKDYAKVINAFSLLMDINPRAALSMVMKAISKKLYYNDCEALRKVWIYDLAHNKPLMVDVENTTHLKVMAYFKTKEDVDKAIKICEPIITRIAAI